jgi:N-acetylglucosaminyl-diphospho-decaprenol L-rhamnosyltransferase
MCELSIVIVNYNNRRQLEECLPTLRPVLAQHDAEVLISDNGSRDGSLAWLRADYPEFRIIENNANLGFAEANNRAFAACRGAYILLLNPDTLLVHDAFRPMLDLLQRNPRIGAVGCKLTNADGSRQVSARSFPTLRSFALTFSGLEYRYPRHRICGHYQLTDWDGESARPVDWICGAALMIRREVLERVGGIDPYYFLTYDEVDWCRRIKDAGYEVWYTPAGRIIHSVGQSEPQSNASPEGRLKYLTVERNSRVHYFVKHHGVVYAALVELLHLAASAALLVKVRLLGTRRAAADVLEQRLLLRLYGRTLQRVPRAAGQALRRLWQPAVPDAAAPYPVLVNPYLEPHRPV